jgi:peptidyl-prolyl cis-trans isomerase D
MLKILRDNLKYLQWILWLVIAVFIAFVFVDFGGALYQQGGALRAAATVESEKISYREFERELRRLEERYRQTFGEQFTPELEKRLKLPLQTLDGLVEQRILAREARQAGLAVSDEEVQRAIVELPALQDAQGRFMGAEAYRRFLRRFGYEPREFEEAVRRDLLIERLQSLVRTAVVVSDQELERRYREQSERASIRYIQLPMTRFQAEASVVAPEELERYFMSHREDYRLPEQRVVGYLLVDSGAVRQGLEATPEALRRFYEERSSEFVEPEQVRAAHILLRVDANRSALEAERQLYRVRSRIEAGESFEALARELSEDPGSRAQGGDLGFFPRGRMVPEFEQAAFGAAPGELVGPVRTSFGYHLIRVLERRPERQRPFEEVEANVRERWLQERAREEARRIAGELRDRVRREKLQTEEAWRALADGSKIVYLVTPPVGREDAVPGIGRNPDFINAVFALSQGESSEVLELPRGFAVARVQEIRSPRVPEFSEVEGRVRAAWIRERMMELAVDALKPLRARLEKGATLEELAKELGLTVEESGEFRSDSPIGTLGYVPELAREAMKLGVGEVGGPLATPSGAVLFVVTNRKQFDPEAFRREREVLRASLARDRASKVLQVTVEQRKRELKIHYDRPLLEQYGLLEEVRS